MVGVTKAIMKREMDEGHRRVEGGRAKAFAGSFDLKFRTWCMCLRMGRLCQLQSQILLFIPKGTPRVATAFVDSASWASEVRGGRGSEDKWLSLFRSKACVNTNRPIGFVPTFPDRFSISKIR